VCRFHGLLRHAWPAPAELQNRVDELAERLGLPSAPAIWLVPGALSPLVWVLGQSPRLVFPARLLERLDDEQRDAILVHELAHVRRRLLMILGPTTPQSLSWAGRLVVISLGLCLLPFLPVEAQTPPPWGADRQRQIEALKEALRVLEEQPDQAGGSTKLKDPK